MASTLPIYMEIANFLENEILIGNLKTDDRVPSTNEFSQIMNVNPATAGKGLTLLVEDGILYKKRGLGMFVSSGAQEKIRQKRKREFFEDTIPDLLREMKKLGIGVEELVEILRGEK